MREAAFKLISIQGIRAMTFIPLDEIGFRHGLSLRDEDRPDMFEEQVYRILSRNRKLAVTEQIHSTFLAAVDRHSQNWYPRRIAADALMTGDPDIVLSIHTADCVPIFLASRSPRAAALIHCGWRGTARNFAAQALNDFVRYYGVRAKDMTAVIGPSICQNWYPVGPEVAELFDEDLKLRIEDHRWLLDLKRANFLQLASAGMSEENIYLCPLCTRCRPDLFYSYRRQGQDLRGKMISFIEVGTDETS
jgi:YfiH family protein